MTSHLNCPFFSFPDSQTATMDHSTDQTLTSFTERHYDCLPPVHANAYLPCEAVLDLPDMKCCCCMGLVFDPVGFNCTHFACKSCAKHWRKEKCPVCNKPGTYRPNPQLQRIANNLDVKCPNNEEGNENPPCNWTGPLSSVLSHRLQCPKVECNPTA